MSTKTKETLTVISQEEIGRDIYSLWLQTDQMAQNARPGQFLSSPFLSTAALLTVLTLSPSFAPAEQKEEKSWVPKKAFAALFIRFSSRAWG